MQAGFDHWLKMTSMMKISLSKIARLVLITEDDRLVHVVGGPNLDADLLFDEEDDRQG